MALLGNGNGLQSQINVTPLVDVVLVLLIIFIVIAPLTLEGYDVDVPGEAVAVAADAPPPEQVVLAVDAADCPALDAPGRRGLPADCRVRLDDEPLPVGELTHRVRELYASRRLEDRVLFFAASDDLNYEAVLQVMDLARAGVEGLRIGIVEEASPEVRASAPLAGVP